MLFAGNVLGQVFFFFGLTHLARVIGPAEFGVWNFAQAWMLYLLRAGEFGLEVVGIREISREPTSTSTWITTIVAVRGVLAGLLFAVTLLAAAMNIIPLDATNLVILSAISVFPIAVQLEWVYEARQEVGILSGVRVLKGLIFLVLVLLLVRNQGDAGEAMVIYVVSVAAASGFILYTNLSRFGFSCGALGNHFWASALRKATPIGMATLLSQYTLFIGTMTVGYSLSRNDLGYFTTAHRIVVFLWAYVVASLSRILLPTLSSDFRESSERFGQFIEKFFRLSVLVVIPFGLVGSLGGTWAISLLFSEEYQSAGPIFAILIWAFVLAVVRCILEIALIASDNQKKYLYGMVFSAVCYTVVTLTLTRGFGVIGAAFAAVVGELIYLSYLMIITPHARAKILLAHLWKPAMASISFAPAFAIPGDIHVVVRLILGFMLYVMFLFGLKALTPRDILLVKSLTQGKRLEASA
jgi:O-antigen/teichoic acid export membrane protein